MIAPPRDPDPAARLHADLFPESDPPGEAALAGALLELATGPSLDFAQLVGRWIECRGLAFENADVVRSLHQLADSGAPPLDGEFGPGLGAATVILPLAGRLHRGSRNLVSGSYHLARLLDPHPVGDFAAVALAVTAACFLGGRRDFVPDVLDVLIGNDAPRELIDEIRRVPVWRRVALAREGDAGQLIGQVGTLLWLLRHEPDSVKAAAELAAEGPAAVRLGRALLALRGRVSGAG